MTKKTKTGLFFLINIIFIITFTILLTFTLVTQISNNNGKVIGIINTPLMDLIGALLLLPVGLRLFKIRYGFTTKGFSATFTMGLPIILLGLVNAFAYPNFWSNISKIPFGQISVSILFSILSGFIIGLFEEMVTRGGIFNALMELNPRFPIANILLSGSIFGLFHIINYSNGMFWDTTNQIVYATGLGVLFTTIYFLTGNIWITIFLHSFVDATDSFFGMISNFRQQASYSSFDWTSALILIVGVVFSIYLYKRTLHKSGNVELTTGFIVQ